jgi:hypothetical protein
MLTTAALGWEVTGVDNSGLTSVSCFSPLFKVSIVSTITPITAAAMFILRLKRPKSVHCLPPTGEHRPG